MGRLKLSQTTIYNKQITGAEPGLGHASETRAKTVSQRYQDIENEEERRGKVEEQHQTRREESMLKPKKLLMAS